MRDPKEIDRLLSFLPYEWKENWCEAETCACLGCVNVSGNQRLIGVYDKAITTDTPISKEIYACGAISGGGMSAVPAELRIMPYLLKCGKAVDARPPEEQRLKPESPGESEDADEFHPKDNWELHAELIKEFEADDVLIKG
ncbi:hypothetical protein LCGC14_1679220, partial [marine sediment metagenome]